MLHIIVTEGLHNNMSADLSQGPSCPLPLAHHTQIIMGHGSGGQLSHDLITQVIQPYFKNPYLDDGDDSACIPLPAAPGTLALTTDSHLVSPLFFPGGDIGRLSVCGTVNDLAMVGATPLYLTLGLILEEGLDVALLQKVLASMSFAAQEAGIQIVAGDTKVVEKGKADQIFINTSGYGFIPAGRSIVSGRNARPGDAVILSGAIGDHGIAVMAARNDLAFETEIRSDVAPLNHITEAFFAARIPIHVMRDPTRGGLGTTLNEIAGQSRVSIRIQNSRIPIHENVQAACDMLGFDPLYVANEGKMIVIAPSQYSDSLLQILHQHQAGREASVIGSVEETMPGKVVLVTDYGSSRLVPLLSGEMLPRIC